MAVPRRNNTHSLAYWEKVSFANELLGIFYSGWFFMLAIGDLHNWWGFFPAMGFWTAVAVAFLLRYAFANVEGIDGLKLYMYERAKHGQLTVGGEKG